MVDGTIKGFKFQSDLEPDGRGSHWFRVTETLSKGAKVKAGDTVTLSIEPSVIWPEPEFPDDLRKALKEDPSASKLWKSVTTQARWDWIRWIRATSNPDTRKKHIVVAFSKLKQGDRRPCCFNRTICTVSEVSKSGALLTPA